MKMKCGACGYEKRTRKLTVDEAIYFRSGKRAGELKEIRQKEIILYEHDPDWIHITLRGLEEFRRPIQYRGLSTGETEDAQLWACPKCGTIKLEGVEL